MEIALIILHESQFHQNSWERTIFLSWMIHKLILRKTRFWGTYYYKKYWNIVLEKTEMDQINLKSLISTLIYSDETTLFANQEYKKQYCLKTDWFWPRSVYHASYYVNDSSSLGFHIYLWSPVSYLEEL